MKKILSTILKQNENDLEKLKKETLKRWQEVENGQVVSNHAVIAWLDTWGTDQESERPTCKN